MFQRLGQRRTTLVLLVLVSITLITFDLRGSGIIDGARSTADDLFSPVQSAADVVFRPVENTWHGIFDYDDVKRERDQLQDQIDAQEGVAIANQAQVKEYEDLRNLLHLPTPSNIPQVIGQVVSEPGSNFDRTVDVSQGSNRGLRVGMPVVNGAGLVGRIMKVYGDRATVRLITDPNFAMAIKVLPGPQHVAAAVPTTAAPPPAAEPATSVAPGPAASTGQPAPTTTVPTTTTSLAELERGWVNGQGADNELTLSQIGVDSTVQVGDLVATSGDSESLSPPDLPVGTVTSVKRNSGSGLLEVKVRPSADVSKLNYVKVLLYCVDCGS
ncbi:MAG TPA: rod shape-determining protein MreC [Acidimicrobiales bacterium]